MGVIVRNVRENARSGVSRRELVAGAGGLAMAVATRGIGRAQEATPSGTPASEWSYTDALGETVTLPERPVRIAAYLMTAAALWDYGIRPVAVFDSTASAHPDGDHPGWGNVDAKSVVNVGNTDGNIEPEALLAVQPDIILTLSFDPTTPEGTAGITPDMVDRIGKIAPVIVVSRGDSTEIELDRLVELAAALGADLSTPEVEAAKAEFESSVSALQSAIAAKSDLTVIFANIGPDELYVAGPGDVSELKYLTSLGLTFANAASPAASEFWEQLSLEEMLKYPSDIFFNDVYSGFTTTEELQAQPVIREHPAIKAGQVGLWSRDFAVNYWGVAGFLDTIRSTVENAVKVS
jgi:iron complex transport system substrate-binding protein